MHERPHSQRRGSAPRRRASFTLLEAMVAVVVLGTAMLVLMETLTRALHAVETIRNTTTACQLLQSKLAELNRLDEIEEGIQEGDFRNEENGEDLYPGFTWTREIQQTELLELYRVRISVHWLEQGHEATESVETYLHRPGDTPLPLRATTRQSARTTRP